MTTKELKERITIRCIGYGTYEVSMKYRGKEYKCTTHNARAYDRINCEEDEEDRQMMCSYTFKGALQALYNEVKRANDL